MWTYPKNLQMKEIFVNAIIEDGNIIKGAAVLNETVNEDLAIIYPKQMTDYFKKMEEENSPQEFHGFDRFCQFVIYLSYRNGLGFSIEVLDFNNVNNVNAAFDYMLSLRKVGWEESDREAIVKIYQEIKQDENGEIGKMVIKKSYAPLS
jgi:hypothetical protein